MIRKESAAMVKQLLLSEHENPERDWCARRYINRFSKKSRFTFVQSETFVFPVGFVPGRYMRMFAL